MAGRANDIDHHAPAVFNTQCRIDRRTRSGRNRSARNARASPRRRWIVPAPVQGELDSRAAANHGSSLAWMQTTEANSSRAATPWTGTGEGGRVAVIDSGINPQHSHVRQVAGGT